MAQDRIDWNAMKLAFITDPNKPTLRQFCGKHELAYSTASKRSSKEDWENHRQTHWQTVTNKAAPILEDMQAVVLARDTASRIKEISTLRDKAFKAAQDLEFEKAPDAISAYEKLSKLERDLSKTTQQNSITLDRLDFILEQYGVELVRALNEHVREPALRSQILRAVEGRWSNIPLVGESSSAGHSVRGGENLN